MNDRWLWAFPAIGSFFLMVALLLQIHRWHEEQRMLQTTGSVVAVSGKGEVFVLHRGNRGTDAAR